MFAFNKTTWKKTLKKQLHKYRYEHDSLTSKHKITLD